MSGVRRLFALMPVVVSFAMANAALAQEDVSAQDTETQTEKEAHMGSPIGTPEEWVAVPTTSLVTKLQPAGEWPEAGSAPQFPLLDYTGVASSVRDLLGSKYEVWLSFLGPQTGAETLPQNLLQSRGCLEPCDMRKALLIVSPEEQGVYVAMVEEGHVTMRPSLMDWPDEAIAPLKKWLADSHDGE